MNNEPIPDNYPYFRSPYFVLPVLIGILAGVIGTNIYMIVME